MITMHDQSDCQKEKFSSKGHKIWWYVRTCITIAHAIYKTLQNLIGTGDRQKIERL